MKNFNEMDDFFDAPAFEYRPRSDAEEMFVGIGVCFVIFAFILLIVALAIHSPADATFSSPLN